MKEFKEFEELQEFKNGNASKNAVITGIADKVLNGNPSSPNTPSLRHSTTPLLHFFSGFCGVVPHESDSVKPHPQPTYSKIE